MPESEAVTIAARATGTAFRRRARRKRRTPETQTAGAERHARKDQRQAAERRCAEALVEEDRPVCQRDRRGQGRGGGGVGGGGGRGQGGEEEGGGGRSPEPPRER